MFFVAASSPRPSAERRPRTRRGGNVPPLFGNIQASVFVKAPNSNIQASREAPSVRKAKGNIQHSTWLIESQRLLTSATGTGGGQAGFWWFGSFSGCRSAPKLNKENEKRETGGLDHDLSQLLQPIGEFSDFLKKMRVSPSGGINFLGLRGKTGLSYSIGKSRVIAVWFSSHFRPRKSYSQYSHGQPMSNPPG